MMTSAGKALEEKALIEEIAKSPLFAGAPMRLKLLRHLFDHHPEPQGVNDLAEKVWNIPAERCDPNRIRAQCSALRKGLREFAASYVGQSRLRCDLPDANLAESYHLVFAHLASEWQATLAFWDAHLKPGLNLIIVCNEPLFFRDRDVRVRAVIRFSDMNQQDTEPQKALEELRQRHPEAYKESLECSHPYLPTGEVLAREHIEKWFGQVVGIRVGTRFSRQMSGNEIAETSPILLGNTRTNRFMRDLLESEDCARLGYKIRSERFGVIEIQDATPKELECLKALPSSGVRENGKAQELLDSADSERYALGLITRMPNPYGEGAITIIAADYTRFLGQIVRSLTDEHRFRQLVARMDWPPGSASQSFQWLVKVRTDPRNVDDERRNPELLAWRFYPSMPAERSSPHA